MKKLFAILIPIISSADIISCIALLFSDYDDIELTRILNYLSISLFVALLFTILLALLNKFKKILPKIIRALVVIILIPVVIINIYASITKYSFYDYYVFSDDITEFSNADELEQFYPYQNYEALKYANLFAAKNTSDTLILFETENYSFEYHESFNWLINKRFILQMNPSYPNRSAYLPYSEIQYDIHNKIEKDGFNIDIYEGEHSISMIASKKCEAIHMEFFKAKDNNITTEAFINKAIELYNSVKQIDFTVYSV